MRLKKAAVTTQCVWRGRVDRKKLWKPWNLSLHIYSQHNNCIERVIPSERFCASENRSDLRRPRVAGALLFQIALIGWQGQLLGTLCLWLIEIRKVQWEGHTLMLVLWLCMLGKMLCRQAQIQVMIWKENMRSFKVNFMVWLNKMRCWKQSLQWWIWQPKNGDGDDAEQAKCAMEWCGWAWERQAGTVRGCHSAF